jgi:PAS domain S-box-containing protein
MRQYLGRLLSEQYEVETAEDGRQALESLRRRPADLILSDAMMPVMDGFELLKQVRANEDTRTIPLILLSARAGEEARIEGLESGADDYLVKPFSARELLARVQTHLELAHVRARSEEALRQHNERFSFVVEACQVGFWFCDLPFDKLIWDRRVKEHFGLAPETEVTIDLFYERLHPDDRERTRHAIESTIANDTPYDIEYRTLSDDGKEKWIRAMGRAFYDAEGRPKRFDGLTMDVTDRKLAEDNYRNLAQTLDGEVRSRTRELEKRNKEVLRQSELLRDLSQRLLQAQDSERRRIARDLHDSSGQTLAALGMILAGISRRAESSSASLVKDAEEGLQLVQQLSQELRTTSYLLHPPLLDESGVVSALQWYVDGFNARSGIDVRLEIERNFGRFSSEIETAIFRIVQEALTNMHRHSGTKSGTIRIHRTDSNIVVSIQDYGKGMAQEKLAEALSGGAGVGFRGIRERVHQLRGEITVESSAAGTLLRVVLPIVKAHSPAGAERRTRATAN